MSNQPDFSKIGWDASTTENSYETWRQSFSSETGRDPEDWIWDTMEKIPVKPLYTAEDLEGVEHYTSDQDIVRPFDNPMLGDNRRNPNIYDLAYRDFDPNNFKNKYRIEMSGIVSERKSDFDLGWGVMRGTERVKADGLVLERNIDYTIEYEMGRLNLISKRALAATNVDIEYQREALFVPETKLFTGAHASMKLPFISESSFIGGSFLYQSASSNDRIPRIGQEPYSKMLLDLNTKIDLEPDWMTKAVNLIPGITSTTDSKVDFEFEIAHSNMDPNEENQAYVDDFESSQRVFPLGESYQSWHKASPPVNFMGIEDSTGDFSFDSLLYRPQAWHTYWFNPEAGDSTHRVLRSSIWNLDASQLSTRSTDLNQQVLRLVVQPAPDDTVIGPRYSRAWAGIMTGLPISLTDRKEDKYLELVLKKPDVGKLHIQLGAIAEDISINGGFPNGRMDTEDTSGLEQYREDLDVGLDGIRDNTQEFRLYPNENQSGWDTIRVADDLARILPVTDDPGGDDYKEYFANSKGEPRNQSRVNGLQDNRGGRLNSEDINFDGGVLTHRREEFFEYTIDFSEATLLDHPFVDTTARTREVDSGWYTIRLPLNIEEPLYSGTDSTDSNYIFRKINTPSWRDIQAVRLIWSDFPETALNKENTLILTQMQFVGNQWQADSVTSDEAPVITATAVNSDENTKLAGQRGRVLPYEVDRDEDGDFKRVQVLQIGYSNLTSDDTVMISRNFGTYRHFDLSMYKNLNMFVRSLSDERNENVQFVFRFGTDDSCYYEYKTNGLYPDNEGWDPRNFVQINLNTLSELKKSFLINNESGDDYDSIYDTVATENGMYTIYSNRKQAPTFSRIEWMGMGFIRKNDGASTGDSGGVWVDELIVKNIKRLRGNAGRIKLHTKWADFFSINSELDYREGDFRTMTDTEIKPGDSYIRGNAGIDFTLDKFLPREWGVSVPLGFHTNGRLDRPQLVPESDISLSKDEGGSDGVGDMAGDFARLMLNRESNADTTNSEEYQKTMVTRRFNTSYDKNRKSKNPLVNLTADRISVDARANKTKTQQFRGKKRNSEDLHVDITENSTYGGWLKYDLSPRKNVSWRPFEKSKVPWLNNRYKRYELNLLPKTFNLTLADIDYNVTTTDFSKSDTTTTTTRFDLKHSTRLDFSPISPILDFGYSLDIRRDLYKNAEDRKDWSTFTKNAVMKTDTTWKDFGILHGEKSRSQKASIAFKPQFFDWLTHDFNYESSYRGEAYPNLDNDRIDMTVDNTFSFSSNFQFSSLFKDLSDKTESLSGLSKGLDLMNKGLNKLSFRTIRFNYDANSVLTNRNMDATLLADWFDRDFYDFFKYQLGVKDRFALGENRNFSLLRGAVPDNAFGGMQYRSEKGDTLFSQDTQTGSQRYSLSTSFSIPSPIDFQFSTIQLNFERRGSHRAGANNWDSTFTKPEIRLRVSSGILSKIAAIDKFIRSLNLSSSFSYKKSKSISQTGTTLGSSSRAYDYALSPLIKVSGTVRKRPIRLSYNHDRDWKYDLSVKRSLTKTRRHNFSLTYNIPQATKKREFKILKWTIPIEGKTVLKLNGDFKFYEEYIENQRDPESDRWRFSKLGIEDSKNKQKETQTVSIMPEISYVFTSKVNGRAFYEYRKVEGESAGDYTKNKFAVVVEVSF